MLRLEEHPTVVAYRTRREGDRARPRGRRIDAEWLRRLCLDAGADDAGFVELERSDLDPDRKDILEAFPRAKTLISVICKMNREPIRSPARSIANREFHEVGDHVNGVCRKIVSELQARGVRALNPAMAFPMEMDRFTTGKIWIVSHKRVAVAAGRGAIGIHRNVIHPQFGSFILLGTIILESEITAYDRPIAYQPCLECKLCVAACPTGAIGADGHFNFSACYTHNYREFMSGFTDWVEQVADSSRAQEYRRRVSDNETVSMWQSLSYGANYKAANCIAVCPAGEDVIGPFLENRSSFLDEVVRPFQDKKETVYVVPGSDPEEHVTKRFPHKKLRYVANGFRPDSIPNFLHGLRLSFQRVRAGQLNAVYHFTFTGREEAAATVVIRDQTLLVKQGHEGKPDLHVRADSETWLGFLRKEKSLVWALLRRRIRIKGSPGLFAAFGKCFPS